MPSRLHPDHQSGTARARQLRMLRIRESLPGRVVEHAQRKRRPARRRDALTQFGRRADCGRSSRNSRNALALLGGNTMPSIDLADFNFTGADTPVRTRLSRARRRASVSWMSAALELSARHMVTVRELRLDRG